MRIARVALRVVCHLVAEVPLFVVTSLQISKGWLPTSDDAVIAWRSWDVFSGRIPLDGQFTQISAASGHASFDLGPLQYFLLAVPARIDPMHGLLWGSAIVLAGLAAIAIEAAWSAAGPVAGLLVAAGLALLTETLVEATVNLAWNPSLGVYALAATMAASLAVARGRFGWLPVAAGTGSLAAQCHMMFVGPVAAALLVGTALGIAGRRKLPVNAAVTAALVVIACFLAPLVQQLTGHPGNWTALAGNLSHEGRSVGVQAGLRGLASAASLPPSWWLHLPAVNTIDKFGRFELTLYRHSAAWGVAALVLGAAIAFAAFLAGRRALAGLAAIATAAGIAAVWTLASVSLAQSHYLVYYLYFSLWPIGMALLASYAIALWRLPAEIVRRVRVRRAGEQHGATPAAVSSSRSGAGTAVLTGLAALTLALAGIGLAILDVPLGSSPLFLVGWTPVQVVHDTIPGATRVVAAHERGHHLEPFTVQMTGGIPFLVSSIDQSIAYVLATRGYPARVAGDADLPLGAAYRAPRGSAVLELVPAPHGKLLVVWRSGARH